MSEDAGVVTISDNGAVTIPIEAREVLDIKGEEALIRLPHIEVADRTEADTPDRVESAGVVRISEDGVCVIPVELRDLLNIKDRKAYLRVKDISVAKRLEDEGDNS